jgi:hypothetical protein
MSNESSKDPYDKKISLKKYNSCHLKHSDYKLPINQNLAVDNYSKTARVCLNSPVDQQIGGSPIKITFGNEQRLISYDQRYSYPGGNAFSCPE